MKILMFSTHSMKYIWCSPQKSKYPLCIKIDKPLVVYILSFNEQHNIYIYTLPFTDFLDRHDVETKF